MPPCAKLRAACPISYAKKFHRCARSPRRGGSEVGVAFRDFLLLQAQAVFVEPPKPTRVGLWWSLVWSIVQLRRACTWTLLGRCYSHRVSCISLTYSWFFHSVRTWRPSLHTFSCRLSVVFESASRRAHRAASGTQYHFRIFGCEKIPVKTIHWQLSFETCTRWGDSGSFCPESRRCEIELWLRSIADGKG